MKTQRCLEAGFTIREAHILEKIVKGAMYPNELIDQWCSSATISTITESLVRKGYITRKQHPTDRRRYEYLATELGINMVR